MIFVISYIHSMRGDFFMAFLFLVVVWLLFQAMWVGRTPSLHDHSKIERKRTILITPEHEDPHIVGDVPSIAAWPKAHYPASRANAMRGEGSP